MFDRFLDKYSIKTKYFALVIMIIVLLVLSSLTFAWMIKNDMIATLLNVRKPDDITILGPNEKELDRIQLNYTEDNVKEGIVTVRRIICIQSNADRFYIELAHTTNMKNLEFCLYKADENGESSVSDNGMMVNFFQTEKVGGSYINLNSEGEYKLANDLNPNINYGNYANVQDHAKPLYWCSNELDSNKVNPVSIDGKEGTFYNTYFVLEARWQETSKETDVFYVMARVN